MTTLWAGITLPPWDADRLYALFLDYNSGGLTAATRDEYARLLMIKIRDEFHRLGYMTSLPRVRMDVEDIAQDTLAYLMRKTGDPGFTLTAPCMKTMVSSLNFAVFRFVTSKVRANRKNSQNASESEIGPDFSIDAQNHAPADSGVGRLAKALKENESLLIAGLGTDRLAMRRLFRWIRRNLLTENTMRPYDALPEDLKACVTNEQHAVATIRINRFVAAYAAAA